MKWKNTTGLSIPIIMILLIQMLAACKHQSDLNSPVTASPALVAQAKDWFQNVVIENEKQMLSKPFSEIPSMDRRRKMARMRGLGQLLDWSNAKEFRFNQYQFVITPVDEPIKPLQNKSFEAFRTLLFIWDPAGRLHLQIMEVISQKNGSIKGNPVEITYAAFLNKQFNLSKPIPALTASIVFYKDNYTREIGYEVKNGQWLKGALKINNELGSPEKRKVPTMVGRTTCTTCTTWYIIGFWYDTNTGEVLDYEILDTITECTEGFPDGYGDPGSLSDEDCTDQLANIVSQGSEVQNDAGSSVICEQSANARKKCYTWKIYNQSTSLYSAFIMSNDEANQEYVNGTWRFTDLNHVGEYVDGTTIGFSLSPTGVTATPSIYPLNNIPGQMARMNINFSVEVCINCITSNFCVTTSGKNASKQWSVND